MERLKTLVLAGTLVLGLGGLRAQAEDTNAQFKQANEAYAQGQFVQAASLYETARAQGARSWILNYNLGNAYYKTGATGKAIASYLRAFRLNPHQRDVVYNLDLALTKVGDPLLPQDALARLFWRLFYLLSLNTLTVLSSILFTGFCIGASLLFLRKWTPPLEPSLISIGVLVLLGVWLGVRISLAEKRQAVVVSGTAEVRSGPSLIDAANFTVPEGRRVLILEDQEPVKGWIEIGVPREGLKGWVPDTAVDVI